MYNKSVWSDCNIMQKDFLLSVWVACIHIIKIIHSSNIVFAVSSSVFINISIMSSIKGTIGKPYE